MGPFGDVTPQRLEELEAFPLENVQGCSTGLDNTVLAISVQERNPPRTSVLLFQCERLGAETLRNSLEKVLRQRKEEQSNHYGHRYGGPDTVPVPAPTYPAPERRAEPLEPPRRGLRSSDYRDSRAGLRRASVYPGAGGAAGDPVLSPDPPDSPKMPRAQPPAQAVSEVDRDVVSPEPPDPPGMGTRQLPPRTHRPPAPTQTWAVWNRYLAQVAEHSTGFIERMNHAPSPRRRRFVVSWTQDAHFRTEFGSVRPGEKARQKAREGRTHQDMANPDPAELLRLISVLSFVSVPRTGPTPRNV
ncbi:epidermal growth factor receptor kinase substrate 8-like protein 3 [Sylvia atricapilla]|uniref:epidermal growth factor receptor kinase substrate 8-like protein 3 n=1 Tax=Sylvia atricapilla TaxID=48155 RepID=UPI003394C539